MLFGDSIILLVVNRTVQRDMLINLMLHEDTQQDYQALLTVLNLVYQHHVNIYSFRSCISKFIRVILTER